jgi:hypothetical protein
VVGVAGAVGSSTGGGATFFLGQRAAGTCAEAVASIEALLPAPLCATGPGGFSQSLRLFACSGSAGAVLEAVGNAAKGVLTLPPAPVP